MLTVNSCGPSTSHMLQDTVSWVKEERGRHKIKKKPNQQVSCIILYHGGPAYTPEHGWSSLQTLGVMRWGEPLSQGLVDAQTQKIYSYILAGFCLAYRPLRPSPDLLLLSLCSNRIPGMWRSKEHSGGAMRRPLSSSQQRIPPQLQLRNAVHLLLSNQRRGLG